MRDESRMRLALSVGVMDTLEVNKGSVEWEMGVDGVGGDDVEGDGGEMGL